MVWAKLPASRDVGQGCTSPPPPSCSSTRPSPSPTPSSCPPTLPSCLTTSMHSFTAEASSTFQQTISWQDGKVFAGTKLMISLCQLPHPTGWSFVWIWIVDQDATGSGCDQMMVADPVDAHRTDCGGRLRGADPTTQRILLDPSPPHSLPRPTPSSALHCTNAHCIIMH